MLAVTSERTEAAAEDSLAAILARSRFGMAIAAMIKMIATTISNSINEKPFCLRILVLSLFLFFESSVSATRLPVLSQLSCHSLNYQSRQCVEALISYYEPLTTLTGLPLTASIRRLTVFCRSE